MTEGKMRAKKNQPEDYWGNCREILSLAPGDPDFSPYGSTPYRIPHQRAEIKSKALKSTPMFQSKSERKTREAKSDDQSLNQSNDLPFKLVSKYHVINQSNEPTKNIISHPVNQSINRPLTHHIQCQISHLSAREGSIQKALQHPTQ